MLVVTCSGESRQEHHETRTRPGTGRGFASVSRVADRGSARAEFFAAIVKLHLTGFSTTSAPQARRLPQQAVTRRRSCQRDVRTQRKVRASIGWFTRAMQPRDAPENVVLQRNMTSPPSSFDSLSDDRLLAEVQRLATRERHTTVELLRALMEVDTRRLYLREGYSSLFTYCTQVLRLDEGAAYNRIETARAAQRVPALLEAIDDGSLTLSSARLLAPHLLDNHSRLLQAARHRSKREVEAL